ncbi:invasion associated locus B family protein [Caldovatus aquaticus]|uniref:Uncharacterized protein n=1 Tax=Caldovatus aquaticus TaxID=2865671 RepID=A0ABS7F631_9PROT|nr:hypothetical protein [Caldovatus aquaticus]MBW8271076.1 hypothetical protein [Caldovatus aquaticus]
MPRSAFPLRAARRSLLFAGLALAGGGMDPALAQQHAPAGARPGAAAAPAPRPRGRVGAGAAAPAAAGGQKVCYAFARAARSEPPRREVLLMVTHRAGQSHDEIAIRAGHAYPRTAAEVTLAAAGREAKLYTNGESAYVRAEDRGAVIAALRRGDEAVAHGPGPGGRGSATDRFPLSGFAAAYEAISRECPAPAPRGGRR